MIVAGRRVFRGTRSLKVSESDFDFIDSPAYPYLAKSTSNGIEFNSRADVFHISHRDTNDDRKGLMVMSPLSSHFDRGVLSLDLTPLYDEDFLRHLLVGKDYITGVVLGSFGAGNVPKRILPVIRDLAKERVPVVITPQRTGFDTAVVYENARLAIEAGAFQSRDMTFEAAAVKLSWLLAHPRNYRYQEDLQRAMIKSFHGEVSEDIRRPFYQPF